MHVYNLYIVCNGSLIMMHVHMYTEDPPGSKCSIFSKHQTTSLDTQKNKSCTISKISLIKLEEIPYHFSADYRVYISNTHVYASKVLHNTVYI